MSQDRRRILVCYNGRNIVELYDTSCCGMKELEGVSEYVPQEVLTNVAQDAGTEVNYAYVIFSDIKSHQKRLHSGWGLASYITKHRLGTTTRVGPARNPHSGNSLYVWVWTVNVKVLTKHLEKLNDGD